MGWDSCDAWRKKSDVVAAVKRSVGGVFAAKSCREGGAHVLWLVAGSGESSEILCVLLEKWNDGRWAYKVMGECEGPYYWSCPAEFLALVKPRNEKWRAQCGMSPAERVASINAR